MLISLSRYKPSWRRRPHTYFGGSLAPGNVTGPRLGSSALIEFAAAGKKASLSFLSPISISTRPSDKKGRFINLHLPPRANSDSDLRSHIRNRRLFVFSSTARAKHSLALSYSSSSKKQTLPIVMTYENKKSIRSPLSPVCCRRFWFQFQCTRTVLNSTWSEISDRPCILRWTDLKNSREPFYTQPA